ncbi:hypothetical protein ONZ43_g4801 [Nemania bipapillata]|uniref:Uncharacterized protein n=1 Tax=Nemania bipapillata TaxID=110536 RepID=A0ACC2II37_9PEZI|nr:hypothetical protein ONZ43_g4801 [Nemania bipapillata]
MSDRRRSQSPRGNRHESYRLRSPSPHRRYGPGPDLVLPRRWAADVPDVRFMLVQNVAPEFVTWAQAAFIHQGLRCDVMTVDSQLDAHEIIQRQVLDGVYAIVELDFRAEKLGKFRLQVFNRSGGYGNVRFDQYQDLEPGIAAQLVNRAKFAPPTPLASSNGLYPPTQHYAPPSQGYYMPPPQANQQHVTPATHGNGAVTLDPVAVHKIIASLNGQQGRPPVDVSSLLATLGNTPQEMGGPSPQHSTNYGQLLPTMGQGAHHGSNQAQHVEDIMAQLSRYRQ